MFLSYPAPYACFYVTLCIFLSYPAPYACPHLYMQVVAYTPFFLCTCYENPAPYACPHLYTQVVQAIVLDVVNTLAEKQQTRTGVCVYVYVCVCVCVCACMFFVTQLAQSSRVQCSIVAAHHKRICSNIGMHK